MTQHKGRIFSGIQPTGSMHLGNYLGAIANWVTLQHDYECLFCIVDMHAITVAYDPALLPHYVRSAAASYLASGINPDTSTIFAQSNVPLHGELAWLLGCHTPLGWLNRMTQFKEKAGKKKDQASLGLYSYPVLMAADILLYKGTHVPVGEDQKQHLELARDIAGAFNRFYDTEYFTQPDPMILGDAARVMSLRDGTKKMSKSDPSPMSRIHLDDDNDTIALKIKKAKSDMVDGMTLSPDRPEAVNLMTIYASITQQSLENAQQECGLLNFSSFKQRLAEALIAHFSPIRQEYEKLMQDESYLDSILQQGADKAHRRASTHIREIKALAGFYSATSVSA